MDAPKLIRSADYARLGQDRRKLATLHHRGEIVRIRRGI
ncbi:type IV toxin-antitoxin system AbiEi family antitoxin domain-containing protein [Arthrobacter sp. E3]